MAEAAESAGSEEEMVEQVKSLVSAGPTRNLVYFLPW